MRFGWPRLILAPLLRQRSRVWLSLLALALGASLMTALLTVYIGVERNLSGQFRRFGANLVATPAAGLTLLPPAAAARALAAQPDSAGILYEIVRVQDSDRDRPVVLAGADLNRLRALNSAWDVRGSLPASGQAWLGVNAARLLRLSPGGVFTIALAGRTVRWRVAGTVQAGTSEDNQIIAPYPQVAALTGLNGYTTLQFRIADPGRNMDAAIAQLRRLLPAARFSPVRQIAAGEAAVLLSTRGMLLTTSLLILLTIGLCVAAALTTLALERRRGFGVMRALGGAGYKLMAAFVGEAVLLGAAAGVLGIAIGGLMAAALGYILFGVWLAPTAFTAVATIAATMALAAIAALLPASVIHGASPAVILRNE